MRLILTVLLFTLMNNSFSKEFIHLFRSPRALLMGDAYTSIANDDEYTLFYNPAALGANQSVKITPLNPTIGVVNALDEMDRFENFPSGDAAAIVDRILGFPLYSSLNGVPTVKMPHFGLSLFAGTTTSMVVNNAVHPSLGIQYRLDKGFATGFAFSFGNGAQRKKGSKRVTTGHRTSVGFGVKHVKREGIDSSFDIFSTDILNTINSGVDSFSEFREALGFVKGKGWGYDFGVEHIIATGTTEYKLGLAVLDIADTKFRVIGRDTTQDVPRQKMNVATGMSMRQDYGLFDWTLALDVFPITEPIDYRRKLHFGGSFGFLNTEFLAGWNGGHFSYGVGINLWPIKIITGFYGVESGEKYKEQKAERFIIQLNIFDIELDVW